MLPLTLYHYTGSEHVLGIRARGITRGGIPLPRPDGQVGILRGYQWLSDDADWAAQGWATQRSIHCDRTEARFRVLLPLYVHERLLPWTEAVQILEWPPAYVAEFDRLGGGGQAHWYVFHGAILPAWCDGPEWRPGFKPPLAAQLVLPGGRP